MTGWCLSTASGEAVRRGCGGMLMRPGITEIAVPTDYSHYRSDHGAYFLIHYSRGKAAAKAPLREFDGILLSAPTTTMIPKSINTARPI